MKSSFSYLEFYKIVLKLVVPYKLFVFFIPMFFI